MPQWKLLKRQAETSTLSASLQEKADDVDAPVADVSEHSSRQPALSQVFLSFLNELGEFRDRDADVR